jgi:hypothetical protein
VRAEILWIGVVFLAVLVIVGINRGWFRGFAAKHYASPDERLRAEFPQAHRHEARQIVEAVAAHADEEMRDEVRTLLLRHARGDIQRLRAAAPGAADGVDRAYALLGRLGIDVNEPAPGVGEDDRRVSASSGEGAG